MSTVKGRPVENMSSAPSRPSSHPAAERHYLTSHPPADLDDLRKREPVAPDAARRRPPALVADRAGHDRGEVGDGSQGHDGFLVAFDDHGAPAVEIEDGLQGFDVVCGAVREGQVIQKKARLEQGVLQDLDGVSDVKR